MSCGDCAVTYLLNELVKTLIVWHIVTYIVSCHYVISPVAGVLNLEMFGNNRFFAFLSALGHEVQESGGCTSDPLLAFSQFKMASKMAAK